MQVHNPTPSQPARVFLDGKEIDISKVPLKIDAPAGAVVTITRNAKDSARIDVTFAKNAR